MSRKLKVPKATTGYAFIGVWWDDGTVGWCGVDHIDNLGRRYSKPPSRNWERYANADDRAYLCKVTITPVLSKNGRPITKKKGNKP